MFAGSTLRGRDTECAALDVLLDAARRGESRTVVLRGEVGVGKTALRYQQPFVDWINAANHSPTSHALTLAEVNQEHTVYLVEVEVRRSSVAGLPVITLVSSKKS